jgi:hypothetical protein
MDLRRVGASINLEQPAVHRMERLVLREGYELSHNVGAVFPRGEPPDCQFVDARARGERGGGSECSVGSEVRRIVLTAPDVLKAFHPKPCTAEALLKSPVTLPRSEISPARREFS